MKRFARLTSPSAVSTKKVVTNMERRSLKKIVLVTLIGATLFSKSTQVFADKGIDGNVVSPRSPATSPSGTSGEMVNLEQILEARAGNMGMVPADAANDPDFIAFMTAIRSRDRSTGKPRPVAYAFQAESETSGLNSYELYNKMKQILTSMRDTAQTLYSVVFRMSQGLGHSSTEVTANLQLSVNRGLRIGFGIGWERRGHKVLPIFTLRMGHVYNGNRDQFTIGVTADTGIETRQSGLVPSMISLSEGDMKGGALGLGWTGLVCSKNGESVKYNGAAVGAGYHCNTDYEGVKLKLPLFFPLPGLSPLKKAMHLETQIIQALQRFDMARASKLAAEYKIQVAKAVATATSQGLGVNAVGLESGHPLSSPGSLFSGSALVAYSPALAPDLVSMYGVQAKQSGKKGGKACEESFIEVTASTVPEKAAPKQLPN
jgi:hypothetical protein